MTSVDLMTTFTVSLFQRKFFRADARDYAFNLALSNLHNDMGHDVAQFHRHNFSFQLVPCRNWHISSIPPMEEPCGAVFRPTLTSVVGRCAGKASANSSRR